MNATPESDNVRLVRRFYEAWEAMDLEAIFSLLDPAVKWINPDYAVEPGTRVGHEGFATVMSNLASSFDAYRHQPGEVVDLGDRLLCHTIFHARGRDSGAQLDIPEQHLWTVRDGRIVELRWFHDAAEAEAAATSG
jgi:ketosteroid isomerase-like protein